MSTLSNIFRFFFCKWRSRHHSVIVFSFGGTLLAGLLVATINQCFVWLHSCARFSFDESIAQVHFDTAALYIPNGHIANVKCKCPEFLKPTSTSCVNGDWLDVQGGVEEVDDVNTFCLQDPLTPQSCSVSAGDLIWFYDVAACFCYILGPERKTWKDAHGVCQTLMHHNRSARLAWIDLSSMAIITDKEKTIPFEELYWVGASSPATSDSASGPWFWNDPNTGKWLQLFLDSPTWLDNQPDWQQANEHCVALKFLQEQFGLDDAICDRKLHPMCQLF